VAEPGVSVLITSFNHERFIADALDGVLAQSPVGPLEVLVGDDCSSDGTRSIIERYARRHGDVIRAVFPDRSLGADGRVLFAELIRMSRGRYIAAMDADDYWTSPKKLSLQVTHLDRHPGCAMCFHNVVCRSEDTSVPDRLHNSGDQVRNVGVAELVRSNVVASCSPVFRREVLDPLPPWYFALPWGDWPLYFMALSHGEVHFLPDTMGVYRLHEDGMYAGLPPVRRAEQLVDFFRGLEGVFPQEEEWRRVRQLAMALSALAAEYVKVDRRDAARRCLSASFELWPVRPGNFRRGAGERRRLGAWWQVSDPLRRRGSLT
jgi:glycosyltransferase involved in cell wall biosynthesis